MERLKRDEAEPGAAEAASKVASYASAGSATIYGMLGTPDAPSESESAYSVNSGGLDSPSSYESNDSAYSQSEGSASDTGASTSSLRGTVENTATTVEHGAGQPDPATGNHQTGVVPLLSSLELCMGESGGDLGLFPGLLDTLFEQDELIRGMDLLCTNGDPIFPCGHIDTSSLDNVDGIAGLSGERDKIQPMAETDTRGEKEKPANITAGGSSCRPILLSPEPAPEMDNEDSSDLELHVREDEREFMSPKPKSPQVVIIEESDEEEPGENQETTDDGDKLANRERQRTNDDSGTTPNIRRIRRNMSESERDKSRARQRKRRREIEESRTRGDSSGSSREDHEYSRSARVVSRPAMQAGNRKERRGRESTPRREARNKFRRDREEARLRAQEEDLRSSINRNKRKLEELRGEDRPGAARKSQSDCDPRETNNDERHVRYKSS